MNTSTAPCPPMKGVLGRLMAAASLAIACAVATAQPADLIVTNAKVVTLDAKSTVAQALAVREGRVLAVGDAATVGRLAGPATRQVDAGGRTVIPGLIDSHLHGIRAALSYATEVNWINTYTIAEAMARLKAKAAAARPGAWLIVAGGWTEQQFAEKRRPTLAEVMAAAPDNPVYIQLFYNSVLITPKGLETLKLQAGAPPHGLTVERDAASAATGWWGGSIVNISQLFDTLPQPTYQDHVAGTQQFFAELNRLGVTGFVDTGGFSISAPQYAALFQLWRDKAMTVRVAYHLFSQRRDTELADYQAATQLMPMGFGDEMLKFNGIGERITLSMYNNNFPDEQVKSRFYEAIRWAADRRMAVTVHWSENSSVGHLLDLFERVNREVPIAPLRWSVAHLENASEENLKRMAALGVGWTVQISSYYNGDALLARTGEEARRMPPVVTARRLGVKVGGGTDAHRVASYNPFLVLQWLLSGRTVSGLQLRSPLETPSREDALRHYTVDAAWFSFDEHQRGSLEPGKLADFAVLDQDVMTVPLERIERTQSLMTVLGGRVVHAAGPFAAPR